MLPSDGVCQLAESSLSQNRRLRRNNSINLGTRRNCVSNFGYTFLLACKKHMPSGYQAGEHPLRQRKQKNKTHRFWNQQEDTRQRA